MTGGACTRRWAVEALHDRQLADRDLASFERHLETCDECTRALSQLRELGTVLADLPAADRTELERRRVRAGLLSRASEVQTGDERRSRRWVALALGPAVATGAVLFLLARGHHESRTQSLVLPRTPEAVLPPSFEVADVDHADFSPQQLDTTSRVTLRSGTASFHVEHVKPGARFLVAVPDGEVEVRGTRFVVEVVDGHTRSVVVTEGVVAVRVGGFEGLVPAGERWQRVEATASASSVRSEPTVTDAPTWVMSTPSSLAPTATAWTPPVTPGAAPPVTLSAERLAGPRFTAAMSAFNAGDYGEADRRLVAFVRDFPSDARAEDAMFLLADARSRRGDASGAREAARDYLRRFPDGLRAPYASRLVRDAPPSR